MSDLNPTPELEDKIREAMDVPNASPAFVNKLRNELVRGPVKMKSRVMFRPAWAVAFVLVLAVLVISIPGVAAALGRLFGYVPGIGLVENTGNLRILAEPVSVTRDGVTITITSAFVYEDRVELAYEVAGVTETYSNAPDMCGSAHPNNDFWSDADADLRLPDGTIVRRDYAGEFQSVNQYAMKPVYAVRIPAGVTELTMTLRCIPFTKLGDVPENWEVPFKLKAVPAGTVVGNPVVEVNVTSEPVVTEAVAPAPTGQSPQIAFTLERVVQTDAASIFYIRLHVANPDPAMTTAFPRDVYVVDSLGQKIQLMNNTMYSEDPNTVWEYVSTVKPSDGSLTLVVNDAVIKYAPLNETIFSFDAGENPQHEQTWELNQAFDIAGYKVNMESVRAVTFTDVEDNPGIWDPNGGPDYPEGSQGFDNGYQFSVQFTSPVFAVNMDLVSDNCRSFDARPGMSSATILYTHLCRGGYPGGKVNIVLHDISILIKNVGQVVWSPENTAEPARSVPVSTTPNIKMTLDRIVPMESATVFYFSMDMENRDPSLISIMPSNVYVIDSQGQKIQLIGNFASQPFEHRVGSLFEYTSQSKPADGPLTVIVENATAFYAPMYTDPPQAKPEEMSFTFDAGTNPQRGQTWDLNSDIKIAGYPLKAISARAVIWDDVKVPEWIDGSQGHDFGYQFEVETDPSIKIDVEMDIMSDACGFTVKTNYTPSSSPVLYTQLCRGNFPTGQVKVTIWQLAVLMENTWQVTWTP